MYVLCIYYKILRSLLFIISRNYSFTCDQVQNLGWIGKIIIFICS